MKTPVLALIVLLLAGCTRSELVPYQPRNNNVQVFNPSRTCTGEDIISRLQRTDPALVTKIRERAAQVPNGKGKFWRIHGQGVEDSYLFGTIHLSHPEQAPLPEGIHHPLTSSRRVLMESARQDMELFMENWHEALEAGQKEFLKTRLHERSIEDILLSGDVPHYKARIRQYSDLPDALWMKMSAAGVLPLLSEAPCEIAYLNAPVVDDRIEQIALLQGKTSISLDTPEDNAALANEIDYVSSEAELRAEILRAIRETDEQYLAIAKLWREGDLGTLMTLPELSEGDGGFFARAISAERHNQMMRGIEKYLPQGGNFIAVGAAHLPGENGLVARLKRAGYTLTPML